MKDNSMRITNVPPEQQAIRDRCFHPSGTFVEFPIEDVETSIPARFQKIVRLYPDRLAVKTGDRSLTYKELNASANQIAHRIFNNCGEGNRPVAILMEHGADVLAAILAVLKAGKIYVPLDPTYPIERLKYVLHDTRAPLVITHNETRRLAQELVDEAEELMNIDEMTKDNLARDRDFFVPPDALAYILYTSGSTGQPKGVFDSHRNVLHGTLRFTNGLHLCCEDRLSLTHSCSTSASVRRIFPAFLNGAALFPFNIKREGMAGLFRMIRDEEITVFSTGRIRDFVRSLTPDQKFPNLRLVSLGGEVVHRSDVDLYRKIFSAKSLIGIWMSSTETGNIAQFLIDDTSSLKGDKVPIGFPAEDVEVMVLADTGTPVEPGEVGELVVKSQYLSPGYWNRPDLTNEKFQSDPNEGEKRLYFTGDLVRRGSDGCLFYLGRKDDQVKINGYRIEIAEVEAALANLGHFHRVCVIAKDRPLSGLSLIAYLVSKQAPAPTTSTLRRLLAQVLPHHMIPSQFVYLESLPLTQTNKIDRKALPDPGKSRPDLDVPFVAPSCVEERVIAETWSEILGIERIGILDNFFDLGGHSLAASRVIARVIQTFQLELPVKTLFESPTVAEMAAVITTNQRKRLPEEDLARMLGELESMSDEEARELVTKATISK